MALGPDIVEAIIREHAYRPITGDVLLIGYQSIKLSRDEVLALLVKHGVAAAGADVPHLVDAQTDAGMPADPGAGMSAAAFFELLGVPEVRTLDSRAGSADIVHDLATPIPDQLKNCTDFIIDGGAVADLYSPAQALRNYTSLLRPNGRLIGINNLSAHFDPYSIPTAAWYLDYFVLNDFADCKVYVLVYLPDRPPHAFCIDIDCLLDPKREVRSFLSSQEMAVIFFAEKSPISTNSETPTHAHQRSAAEWTRYRKTLGRIKLGARPHLVRSRAEHCEVDFRGGHLFMQPDYTPAALSETKNDVATRSRAELKPGKLRVLCVGTGRDGTQSLYHMIQHIYSATGDQQAMHEYANRQIYQAFSDFRETNDDSYLDDLGRMVADCPYDCIVGNGYAPILPLFADYYGPGLKVVHLYRADRDACIASLIRNCELFPAAYGYYSSSPEAVVKRMAAFHFGEMPKQEWDRLPLEEKFFWYYDKTHALVRQHLSLFDSHIELATENLNDDESRRAIADFVGSSDTLTPPRAHLNASSIDIASFPKEHQHKMHWLMGQLNIDELANDDVYAIDYFLDKFVAWTGYQIADPEEQVTPASVRRIAADLERAARVMDERLRQITTLHRIARDRALKECPKTDLAAALQRVVGWPRTMALATAVVDYQKHRVKKLRKQGHV